MWMRYVAALDFLLSTPQPPKEVIIAEGANESFSGEAFQIFGYEALQAEYDVPIRLVDLHQETEWVETTVFLSDRGERDCSDAEDGT